jgi:hypothetical protein
LDKHNQSGSHWVAAYADLKRGHVYFYDSYATKPKPEIRKFMRRVAEFCKKGMGLRKVVVDVNKIQHQYGNSECGVYSINFIVRLLGGTEFKKIENDKLSDNMVNKCRNVYFGNTSV